MNERELTNKLNAAIQTLQIYQLYEAELLEQFGEMELRRKIDIELDKVIYFKKQIANLKSKDKDNEK